MYKIRTMVINAHKDRSTLEEINEEIQESFKDAGGEVFMYIPCLNDHEDHIDALSKIIDQNLLGWV